MQVRHTVGIRNALGVGIAAALGFGIGNVILGLLYIGALYAYASLA